MSILLPQTQGHISSSSSSSLSNQSPNSNHGDIHSLSPPEDNPISFRSSDNKPAGMVAPAAEDYGGSSKEVTGLGELNDHETLSQQDRDRQFESPHGGRPAHSKGKTNGAASSPGLHITGPANSQEGSSSPSVGRRAHMISGNHLLNFQYDPIARPQQRGPHPPPRRQPKRQPYNKDLFLQANYKFVVLDNGNYATETMDPDKMLQWEDIICVKFSTSSPVQCPICLEYPLCPQMTSCGHIFCFPCILQYLLMGEGNHKVDCFKRCPLCFVMVSPKDLYTIYIENLKQYVVGDRIDFTHLTRHKGSFALSQNTEQETALLPRNRDETHDPFSKFTFTSDVDLSVRQAMSDLDSWLVRAESGLVDDLEKLPYVSAALTHLEQRKQQWNEHRACNSYRLHKKADNQMAFLPDAKAPGADRGPFVSKHESHTIHSNDQKKLQGDLSPDKSDEESGVDRSSDEDRFAEGRETIVSASYEEKKGLQKHPDNFADTKEKDSYYFYQAADGQHIILHPLNMKCLLHHYGSYDMLPPRISGRILELEMVSMSEAMRKRYRYLSHFSLTTAFQLCEIDLREMLPPVSFFPFMDEIKKRERQRRQSARKERSEKIKAEVAAATEFLPLVSTYGHSSRNDSPPFTMDDFEALGTSTTSTLSSSPPVVGERKLFSNVTRLGFAAAHDSPGLKMEGADALPKNEIVTNGSSGSRNSGTPSFANVISRSKMVETLEPKMKEMGKKGKKPSRVLLSTSGGRRY